MNSNYKSTKVLHLGSCAFRQPKAMSHCKFLHGYRLTSKITFGSSTLDHKNWVVDFGSLKEVKKILEDQFDHTTCIDKNDEHLEDLKSLHNKGVIDLRIMDGVGIEKFAEWVFNAVNSYIIKDTAGRCWVEKVEVWEHPENSAIYTKPGTTVSAHEPVKVTTETVSTSKLNETPVTETFADSSAVRQQKVTSGFSNLFGGTSWGR